jgi:probable rRNA maturation factor
MLSYEINDKQKCITNSIKNKFNKIIKFIDKKFKINKKLIFDISLISKIEIKKINFKYRKINEPTDVITFAFHDAKYKTDLLGEIFICFQYAKQYANANKTSIDYELINLLIHGILHLLGFEHKTKKTFNQIIKLQQEIISIL